MTNGIADRHREGTGCRDETERVTQFAPAACLAGSAERVDWTGAGAASQAHFPDDTRGADQGDEDKVRDQERAAAVQGDAGGKHPEISHADRRSDTGEDEAPLTVERFSFFHEIVTPQTLYKICRKYLGVRRLEAVRQMFA